MKKGRTYILGLLIMLLAPLSANAQWSFDVGTVEAYINDHKQQRSLLLARSTLEHSNKLLHEYIIGEFKCTVFPIQMYKKV